MSDQSERGETQGSLRRMLGPISVGCVGIGAAIGSGIFATPHEAAKYLHSPWMILALWIVAGFITFLQTLVTAELATRVPKAGGEYQYLKDAYGPFAGFFFGWSFTLFIVGGGAGTIAALFGDVVAELLRLQAPWASALLGCSAIITVAVVNAVGLRSGAVTQNILTIAKTLSLVGIAIAAVTVSGRLTPAANPGPAVQLSAGPVETFFLALLPIFWSYTGATDSAKLAEETRDSSRSLPRALCGSAVLLTVVYLLYNYALFCAASPDEMALHQNVPTYVFARAGFQSAGNVSLAVAALVCLGAISSTILANVRVLFAMARDGLAPKIFAKMSEGQSPAAAIVLATILACSFVINRRFERILRIYFLASALLFGMTYLSLIIIRWKQRRSARSNVFRMPFGLPVVVVLVAIEIAIAVNIIRGDIRDRSPDSLYTLCVLAGMVVFYVIWRRFGMAR